MRTSGTISAVAAAVFGIACATTTKPASPPPAVEGPLAPVAFLQGAWTGHGEGGVRSEETWSAAADGMMLGTGRVFVGSKVVFFEYLQLAAQADGGVVYRAWPKGVGPTEFQLTAEHDGGVTFENPAHDFPKRIDYAPRTDGRLDVTVSGGEKRETWVYERR